MKFQIGIATRIAIFIALIIGGYYLYQQKAEPPQPPMIERTVQGIESHDIAPTPEFFIRQRKDLQLTDPQVKQITALASAYRKEIKPYQEQLNANTAQYTKNVDKMKEKRVSVDQLQTAATSLQHLSSVISTTRKAYYKKCYAVLTVKQQKILDGLIVKVSVGDLL